MHIDYGMKFSCVKKVLNSYFLLIYNVYYEMHDKNGFDEASLSLIFRVETQEFSNF